MMHKSNSKKSIETFLGLVLALAFFHAGNAADPRAQVITAAGAGSAAAIAINADLVRDDVQQAVADRRP